MVRRFATCFFVSMFMASNAMAGTVPGTSVSMTPPAGYVAADRFPGFTNEASGSSIMVTEIPGPYSEATAGFSNKSALDAQGMKLLSKSPATVDGLPCMLLELEQQAFGKKFRKWIIAADRSSRTTLIVASYPENAVKAGGLLKQAMLSARFVKAGDPAEALAYTTAPAPPFKVAKVIGQLMLLTPEGVFPVKDETVPLMAVGLSFSKDLVIADKKIFAEDRIRKTSAAGLRNISVSSSTPVVIDGMAGIETIAAGEGAVTATPLTIYQVLLFDGSGYCVIQGLVPSKEKNTYIPVFEKIARSFRMKAPERK